MILSKSQLLQAYYDAEVLKQITLENVKYSEFAIFVFPFFRDACLFIYEFQKFRGQAVDKRIESIRHRIHLYEKTGRGANFKYFSDLLDLHRQTFSHNSDNLGFFVSNDNKVTFSSTLYISYLLGPGLLKESIRNDDYAIQFSEYVGQTLQSIQNEIIDLGVAGNKYQLHFKGGTNFHDKDVDERVLFQDSNNTNLIKFRLLLSLFEIRYIQWLHNSLAARSSLSFLEKYAFIKYSAIRFDETRDNLLNMKKFINKEFQLFYGLIPKNLKAFLFNNSPAINKLRDIRNAIHINTGSNYIDILQTAENYDQSTSLLDICMEGYDALNNLAPIIEDYIGLANIK